MQSIQGLTVRPTTVNGQPGAVGVDNEERVMFVWSIEIADGHIAAIHSVVNPDKLRHLGPLTEVPTLLRRTRPEIDQ